MSNHSDSGNTKPYLEEDESFNFDLTVFDSIKLSFEITNTTTNTEVKKNSPVQLVELLDRGAMLEIPARSCSRGHNLMVKIRAAVPKRDVITFSTTAKVDSIESFEDAEVDQVTLSFLQYDVESWQAFQELYSARQEEIMKFLQAAKGY